MKDYDIYIFDFDGTVFDTKVSLRKVYRDSFAAANIFDITDEECAVFMHHSLIETVQMRHVDPKYYEAFGEACKKSLDDPETIRQNVPFPESLEVIQELLKRGKRVAVASGNTVKHIKLVLEDRNWPDVFEAFVGSDIYKNGKPSPEPLQLTMRMLGVEPSDRIVYIGDSLQDDIAGRAAGIDTILIDREDEYPEFEGTKIRSLRSLITWS